MINLKGQHATQAHRETIYLTPPHIIEALGGPDRFDLDPCAADFTPHFLRTARKRYAKQYVDGLNSVWNGRVWLNPPFGKEIGSWIKKFVEHDNGIALVPASSTETKWGQLLLSRSIGVLFLAGRLKFYREDGSIAQAAFVNSMLCAVGISNFYSLESSKLPGVLFQCGQSIFKA